MAALIKQIKNVPKRKQLIVSGYVHEIEKLSSNTCSIPILITNWCILFSRDEDYFISGHEFIKLSNNKKTITKYGENGWKHLIKGYQIISSDSNFIAKWKILIDHNINKTSSRFGPFSVWIGLIDTEKDIVYNLLHCNNQEMIQKGDIITFILDLKENKIKYQINNGDINIFQKLCLKRKIKFRFGANLWNIGNSISMIDFQIDG